MQFSIKNFERSISKGEYFCEISNDKKALINWEYSRKTNDV